MRVLLVEDSRFNAFCLTRLLKSVFPALEVVLADSSRAALQILEEGNVLVVILDGDLGAADGLECNGPALAHAIWQIEPRMPVIAWSDSEPFRQAFSEMFKQHNRPVSDYYFWPKIVSQTRIFLSLITLIPQLQGSPDIREPVASTSKLFV